MRTHEIHRLPVVDTRGRPIGILSLSDVINHWHGDRAAEQAVEIAATFSAIRRRRERTAAAHASSNGGTPNGDASSSQGSAKPPPKRKRTRAPKPSADLS
jgi:hypothetical protein